MSPLQPGCVLFCDNYCAACPLYDSSFYTLLAVFSNSLIICFPFVLSESCNAAILAGLPLKNSLLNSTTFLTG